MDSIDAVLVNFSPAPFKVMAYHQHKMPEAIKAQCQKLIHQESISKLMEMDVVLGQLFSEAANAVLKKASLTVNDIQAIGSHGQTIRHTPNGRHPTTLQIGDPNIISANTNITTVADFRRRDMAKGGQGGPLAPAFHHVFFQDAHKERIILNLGGIANITLLPPKPCNDILGFDTGPANTLLDAWITQHRKQPFDHNGEWAKQSDYHPELLEALMNDPYFALPPPKSTGLEYFNLKWLNQILVNFSQVSPTVVQATLTELTAKTVANAIHQNANKNDDVIVCGGGAHNAYLMQRLAEYELNVASSENYGIHPDWVEAILFAWFAKQRMENNPIDLRNVTGAKEASILGGVYR